MIPIVKAVLEKEEILAVVEVLKLGCLFKEML